MLLNKNKGRWYSKEAYQTLNIKLIPTELDDIAYHLYCSVTEEKMCSPQVTFACNKTHHYFIGFYKQALRLKKLEKVITNINDKR